MKRYVASRRSMPVLGATDDNTSVLLLATPGPIDAQSIFCSLDSSDSSRRHSSIDSHWYIDNGIYRYPRILKLRSAGISKPCLYSDDIALVSTGSNMTVEQVPSPVVPTPTGKLYGSLRTDKLMFVSLPVNKVIRSGGLLLATMISTGIHVPLEVSIGGELAFIVDPAMEPLSNPDVVLRKVHCGGIHLEFVAMRSISMVYQIRHRAADQVVIMSSITNTCTW